MSPIYGVQDDNDAAPLGFAVGIKEMPNDFYQKLIQPGEMSTTAQNYLVRRDDKSIEYLSPLRLKNGDLQQPLIMTLDAQNPSLAAAFAVETGPIRRRIRWDRIFCAWNKSFWRHQRTCSMYCSNNQPYRPTKI